MKKTISLKHSMILKNFESGPVFRENTYLLISGKDAVIIDPGADPEKLIRSIEGQSLHLEAVLATHGHIDHILAAKPLCEHFSCPFMMSEADRFWLNDLKTMCERFRLPYYGTPVIDRDITGIKTLELASFKFDVLHTPGHSPGSVCFVCGDILFSGDTLFHRSVGRSDLTGGDMEQMLRSIREHIWKLPDETIVYPGHLNTSTVGEEKKHNPFILIQ